MNHLHGDAGSETLNRRLAMPRHSRYRGARLAPSALGAVAFGAVALGAMAIGALAIGRLAGWCIRYEAWARARSDRRQP